MHIFRLMGLAMFAAGLVCGTTGCANLSLFSSQHVHREPDPNEAGKIDALERQINQLERQQAAQMQEVK